MTLTSDEQNSKVRRIANAETDVSGALNYDSSVAMPGLAPVPASESIPPIDPTVFAELLPPASNRDESLSEELEEVSGEEGSAEECVEDEKDPNQDYSGPFVPTYNIKNDKGTLEPRKGWSADKIHGVVWLKPEEGVCLDMHEHNKRVSCFGDIAWAVSSIRCVRIELVKKELQEVVEIGWVPCWVPLKQVNVDTPKLEQELVKAKATFAKKGPQAKANFRRRIPGYIKRFLNLGELSLETKFYLIQIHQYALIKATDGSEEEAIRAEFADSFEHCSALFRSPTLWLDVYKRRQEAAKAMIRNHPKTSIYQVYLKEAIKYETMMKKATQNGLSC